MAADRPEAVLPSLEAIAGAGADALASMRRLVGVLRSEDEASRVPVATLADLRLLVDGFASGGPRATLDIGQGIGDTTLAPEVLTTLHRVLLESLTNVRRHAPGAVSVAADLRLADGGALLRVRDHGSSTGPRSAAPGGGYGLIGMAERVGALGGHLTAGPADEASWQVSAWFPIDPR